MEEGKDSKFYVCLCPTCHMPLFSDSEELDKDNAVKCGLCEWNGKIGDVKKIDIKAWRTYLFNPSIDMGVPPLPRNVFFMSSAERIQGLIPDMGLFLAKWGVLSIEDLQQPWLSEVFKRASWMFFRVIAEGVNNPPVKKTEEVDKDPRQLELPLGSAKKE